MNNNFLPEKTKLKNVKYFFVGLLFCIVAATPILHTFLPKNVDYCYDKTDIILTEGLNSFEGVDIYISNGKIVKVQKINSEVINKIFGWSNWRKFLLLGSPYFCLATLSIFSFWVFLKKNRDEYFKRTVLVVLSFFSFVSVYFSIYALLPKNEMPYSTYYILLFIASIALNLGGYNFFKFVKAKSYSIDNLMIKIRSLTRFISEDIYTKYIAKADQKNYLIDMAKNYKELNN